MMSFISFPIPYTSAAILWATSLLWAVFGVNTIDFGIHVYCAVGTTIAFLALNGIVALNLEELGLKPQPKTKKKAKEWVQILTTRMKYVGDPHDGLTVSRDKPAMLW